LAQFCTFEITKEDKEMELGEVVQLAGVLIALGALGWTAYGVHLNRKTTQAQFWLQLRDDFARYDQIHLYLRPGGIWTKDGQGPQSVEEWAQLEGYMGLFEHCESMLRQGLLDEKVFIDSFKYRVVNIYSNPTIKKAKLIDRAAGWTRFLELGERLGIERPSLAG